MRKGDKLPIVVDKATVLEPGPYGQAAMGARPILGNVLELRKGVTSRSHSHSNAQLSWPVSGLVRITTANGSWMVPSTHAVWIPGGQRHRLQAETDASLRHIFLDPAIAGDLAPACSVVEMTPLMGELINRIMTFDQTASPAAEESRLLQVAVDELARLAEAPLFLPAGNDRRLQRVMRTLTQSLADSRPLPELAAEAGASPRTLERLFRAETGMSFQQWRTRLRMLQAINLLSRGMTTTTIADELGFSSASAFGASFRSHFGKPPQSFIRDR